MPQPKSLLLSIRNIYETLYISVPTMVDAFRGTLTPEACDERLTSWSRSVVENARMRITVAGREHVPTVGTGPLLVMSNHQSHYDVAVIYATLGGTIRMVAKRELFDVPVFGRAMRAAGFVSVDRQNHKSAVLSLEDAKRKLAGGIPMWIAPEGTRSETGALQKFKKGGFVLSIATSAPILPVTIDGTREVLPAHGMLTRPEVDVRVTIHEPIDPAPFAAMTEPRAGRDALAAAVRRAIESGLRR